MNRRWRNLTTRRGRFQQPPLTGVFQGPGPITPGWIDQSGGRPRWAPFTRRARFQPVPRIGLLPGPQALPPGWIHQPGPRPRCLPPVRRARWATVPRAGAVPAGTQAAPPGWRDQAGYRPRWAPATRRARFQAVVSPGPPSAPAAGARPEVCADAEVLYGALGPWTRGDQDNGWALLLLCDALARMIQPVDDLVRDHGVLPGWSQVLDLERCPTECLPWLGQFAGVDVDPAQPDAAQRDQIATRAAEGRGTPAAILAAARRYLIPEATVRLTERDGDAYHVTISVFPTQFIGASYNAIQRQYPTIAGFQAAYPSWAQIPNSVAEFTSAVLAAIPAGLVVTINTTGHATYSDIQATYPTQAGFQAAFATWNDVASWVPPS